ncbi:MAG TPA: OmpA family protein [Bacteroidales bacterium]|nr:OmpA family protein [Bacteroidales bacterium]HPT21568.1 OmpA family protein [Bacteroidales bacterium]
MKSTILLFILVVLISLPFNANCQIRVDLKKKIENQANNRVNKHVDNAINKGMDDIENGIKDGVKKDEKKDQTQANQKNQDNQPSDADNLKTGNQSANQDQTPLQMYSKYDFIPGEKIIFFDDFSQDAVGDFPALWNTNGSAEVVTTNLFPGNWMKFVMRECVWTDALIVLPDNYTIEFDIIPLGGLEGEGMSGYYMRLMQAKNVRAWDGGSAPGEGGFLFHIEYFGRPSYVTWNNKQGCQELNLNGYLEGDEKKQKINQKYHIAIWVQKSRIRLYQGQNKLIDLPKAFQTDCIKPDRIRFESGAAMVSNIRVAVGAPDMRNKLITEGKLITYGIYFDVNKDIVKPESYGTLKEIAKVLTENPDVRVKIVGHTDSDGADAANLDLSKRRGASVKNELVKSFGIDAARLESDGMGESQPIAPNDTPANKALNRRVEFIKL